MANEQEIKFILKAVAEGRGFDDIQKGLQKTSQSTNQLQTFFKGLLPALGVSALVAGFVDVTKAALDSEKQTRILSQTIKNVGLSGKVSTQEVQDFADGLSNLSGVMDEEVIQSFNEFIKITKDAKQAEELTKLALDMAAGSGKSLAETTDALNGLLLGQSRAMKQYGVDVKETDTTLQVLTKTTELYAGQAERLGQSTEGSMNRAMASLDNLKETLGATFLPMIGWFADLGTNVLKVFNQVGTGIEFWLIKIKALGNLSLAVMKTMKGEFDAIPKAMKENAIEANNFNEKTAQSMSKIFKEQKKNAVDLNALKDIHTKLDEQRAKKAEQEAKELEKKQKEKSKSEQDYWNDQVDLAGKSRAEQRKILEKSLQDKYLTAEDAREQQHKLDLLDLKDKQDWADQAQTITDAVASGNFDQIKAAAIAQIRAWGQEEIAKALISAPLSFGGTLGAIAPILAAVAAGTAAINAVKLADGGIVTKPTNALIGEAGAEAVIPLKKAGALGANTVNISAGAFMGNQAQALKFAKMIQKELNKVDRRKLTL